MKNIKKLGLLMFVLMMLLPSFAMAKEEDMKSIEDQIRETIDYSDREIFGTNYSLRSAGIEDFAVYHREESKLSMADGAFDKEKSIVEQDENNYIFTFYTKPVTKKMFGKYYEADCTELKFIIKGQEVNATPFGSKKATSSEKMVPEGFTITVPKSALFSQNLGGYSQYFKIKFETNLEDSGALGVIGDKMMNRNARLFVR
ncbi:MULTISPECIES: hypothetical protein [Peptoniphilus]|uniref:hypothetical protein n=1 Tax=Peptoniphilus TaxID=162289 RepID=UPI000289A2AE|nr:MULTISPECIES: hypothetical protein [Peptoniphilus]MDU1955703.1 hypothetical protein [Peptoniphilus lacydonensis]MDU2116236.1 hypothetical protein [Peptoniphilus lacydonensis]MDU3751669.1 hypothetical protein [Peptoniphilus rhinitidis]MDU5275964.1 hypothetical protein [Peptoniphilus lacydonensis]MDU5378347.1 hypothetical protein [Peptoniphilus lacydonensis]